MHRVVHFELAADDPERAIAFYRNVFGWSINKWEGPQEYYLVQTGQGEPGIDGGILRRREPTQSTVNTIEVADVDEMLRKAKDAGGVVVAEKMPIPGVGYLAYLDDPEGNTFGIMQMDENAR
ncbi:MAG: VOC family protein [bacterium]|nr:VOC family protein [bacterium]